MVRFILEKLEMGKGDVGRGSSSPCGDAELGKRRETACVPSASVRRAGGGADHAGRKILRAVRGSGRVFCMIRFAASLLCLGGTGTWREPKA